MQNSEKFQISDFRIRDAPSVATAWVWFTEYSTQQLNLHSSQVHAEQLHNRPRNETR
jgi:hypothetical protein